jgi:hypothetical protein
MVVTGLPPYEEEALRHLRSMIAGGWGELDRQAVAIFCTCYIQSFLKATHSRWSSSFGSTFSTVAQDVAQWETAHLLEVSDEWVTRPRRLLRGLAGSLGIRHHEGDREGDPTQRLLAEDDESLAYAFRRLLRLVAHQGMIREHEREQPQEALVKSSLRRWLRTQLEVRVTWDARRHLLVSRGADISRPPLQREDLREALASARSITGIGSLAGIIRERLAGDECSPAYCYFHDAVHVIHERLDQQFRSDADGTGAIPTKGDPELTRSGILSEAWRERARSIIAGKARSLVINDVGDADRGPRRGRPPATEYSPTTEVREAWATIAAEKTLRLYNLGRPEWEGLTETELIRLLIQDGTGGDLQPHRVAIDYTRRRLRRWIRECPQEVVRLLWGPLPPGGDPTLGLGS